MSKKQEESFKQTDEHETERCRKAAGSAVRVIHAFGKVDPWRGSKDSVGKVKYLHSLILGDKGPLPPTSTQDIFTE